MGKTTENQSGLQAGKTAKNYFTDTTLTESIRKETQGTNDP